MKRTFSDFKTTMRPIFEADLNGRRGMISHESDRVIAVVGSEGSGKSTWGLNAFELWGEVIGKPITADDIKFICSNSKAFGQAALDAKKLQMIIPDEGALMSYSRQGMSQSNTTVNKFLMTCREEGFYVVVMIPNIMDLDSYIRKNRLTALVVILPNYRFAYFSRNRIRKLLPKIAVASKNNEYPNPMTQGVAPNFTCKFTKYTGVLLEPYKANKKVAMQQMRQEMRDLFTGEKKSADKQTLTDQQQKVLFLSNMNYNLKSIGAILNITASSVHAHLTAIKKHGMIVTKSETQSASNFEIADAKRMIAEGRHVIRDTDTPETKSASASGSV
jgi:DNA-binding CsgD family transcriptional regulator